MHAQYAYIDYVRLIIRQAVAVRTLCYETMRSRIINGAQSAYEASVARLHVLFKNRLTEGGGGTAETGRKWVV